MKIRVLIAKIGLDGHDRGAKIVARALKDAGMEVIYTGIRQTVEGTIATAIEEDVHVLGLSFLAGDHMVLIPKVLQGIKAGGRDDILVIVGGVILKRHVAEILKMGVKQVFLPGTPLEQITDYISTHAR